MAKKSTVLEGEWKGGDQKSNSKQKEKKTGKVNSHLDIN